MSTYDTWRDQMQQEGPPLDCAPHGVPEHECLQCEIDQLQRYLQDAEDEAGEMQDLLLAIHAQLQHSNTLAPAMSQAVKNWAARYGK